jgi:hypothetical protein
MKENKPKMQARTNTIYNKPSTVCILVGYYGEKANYCEEVFEDINLNDLPSDITSNIDLNHDVSLQIVPGDEIRVFAKNMDTIKSSLEIINEPDGMKFLLDWFSESSQHSDYCICGTQDLEKFKRQRMLSPIND